MGAREARVRRERKTVAAMVRVYCRGVHGSRRGLCGGCEELLGYAFHRLDRCPLMADKPTCAKCTVHCYEKGMRERIRTVMRYSGPRMLYSHPVLAIRHIADGRRGPRATERAREERREP
ncbi:MAG: hypothetical protein A3K67_08010 [Euryarchaeota archaeon RBG_16_62_10]|nr:MAG: hypothetical protein A3K67_08010 [Euryarchaeota archaeon RBG_16_62_10]